MPNRPALLMALLIFETNNAEFGYILCMKPWRRLLKFKIIHFAAASYYNY